ncbi:WEB family protein [Canna indica]|uniref:WEB family protein n=1 Tax=Canna indica TaxID=4628 RepID=A0AAQ3Q4E5_9LILI|nr:WEB family protein [Canna indica]
MASERAEVDTRRPFRPVKEAVAVFGDRLLPTNPPLDQKSNSTSILHAKPLPNSPPQPPKQTATSASSSPPSYSFSASHSVPERDDDLTILASLKRLEADMKETRRELLALKERESETAVAVAELNESMAKLEAANGLEPGEEQESRVRSERWHEEREEDLGVGLMEYLPTLAQAFTFDDFGGWRKMKRAKKKKKPVVPLIWDIFPKKKKKGSHFSLYSRSLYSDLG